MGDASKEICRLCLNIVPVGEGEVIEETKKEKLEVLMIHMDLDVSDDAVACKSCVEKLDECSDFKSTFSSMDNYVIPFVNVDIKVDVNSVFLKETSEGKNVNLRNDRVCQLCMLLIKDESFNCTNDSKDGVLFKEMIRNCLPEVDLHAVHEPLVCKQCLDNTIKYSDFMKTCHEVEQRIQNYCRVVLSYGKIMLKDVLQFTPCDSLSESIIIKKECPDVEYVDANTMECLKSEKTASVMCEDVDIKDELNIKVETSESNQPGDCNSSGKNGSTKGNTQNGKSVAKGRKRSIYFCSNCSYSCDKKDRLEKHMQLHMHSDNKVHKCCLCPFAADTKFALKAHMLSHRGPTKAYGCSECPYETNLKPDLATHILKHKDQSEVEMHKCPQCSFVNKYKSTVRRHQNLEHNEDAKMYECHECSYSTKRKKNMVCHQLVHKNPGEIPMFKCENCEYETKYKANLVVHMQKHQDSDINSFKCDKCPYSGKKQRDLKRHMVTHTSDIIYSCDKCTYFSNLKRNLLNHKRVHLTEGEKVTLQCDQCDFHTKYKSTMRDHKHRHDPERPIYKCEQCEYTTRLKVCIIHHQMKHKELGEAAVYYCATCHFKTKYKTSLLGHSKICLKRKQNRKSYKVETLDSILLA